MTGNGSDEALITAYDLSGVSIPSYKLLASYFKAGSELNSSVQLVDGVEEDIPFELVTGANSTLSLNMWLSVPNTVYPQSYVSTVPWSLIGTSTVGGID